MLDTHIALDDLTMSNVSDLTRLALCVDDKWSKRSTVSAVLEWHASDGVEIEEEESARVRNMIEECGFTQTVLMPNFDARLHTVRPPTGYAAVWHADSMFVADAFDMNIFRFIQGISISAKRRPNVGPHVVAALNALLGDASPVPCISRSQKGNWVCSLGSFGWVGLYDQYAATKPAFAVVVVSGLDPVSYSAMQKEMRDEWHRKLTLKEVYPRLEFWRELSRQNGERILATFIRVLGEHAHDASRMSELSMMPAYDARCETYANDSVCSAWLNHPKLKIPKWFVFPSVSPRGCGKMPAEPGVGIKTAHEHTESVPWTVVPDFSVCLDNVAPYAENEYVRFAGCCDSRDPVRAVVRGPTDELLIIETPGSPNPLTLHAFAAQATQHVNTVRVAAEDDEEDEHVQTTWEDAAIERSRMVRAAYTFRSILDPIINAQRLMPQFVRVSCRDALGLAEMTAGKGRRLASLVMDDWVPIQR